MSRHVIDLVSEQRRELVLVAQPREHAGMHVDVPVRQRERVRRRVAEREELVLDVVVRRLRSDLVADAAQEREHLRLFVEQRLRVEVAFEVFRFFDQAPLVRIDGNRIVNAGGRSRGRRAQQHGEPRPPANREDSCMKYELRGRRRNPTGISPNMERRDREIVMGYSSAARQRRYIHGRDCAAAGRPCRIGAAGGLTFTGRSVRSLYI